VAQTKDSNKAQLFINGTINPQINIRPGELQRWRIYNMNPDYIVKLGLEGQAFQLLATDGNTLEDMQPVDEMLIGTGSRREVLVRGGTPGSYKLEALPFDQLPVVSTSASTLATLVSGDEAVGEQNSIGQLEEQDDLHDVPSTGSVRSSIPWTTRRTLPGSSSTVKRSTTTAWTRPCNPAPSRSGP
jgi:FtsP/CotA-like multicopper oxidase with cupredoxin domain